MKLSSMTFKQFIGTILIVGVVFALGAKQDWVLSTVLFIGAYMVMSRPPVTYSLHRSPSGKGVAILFVMPGYGGVYDCFWEGKSVTIVEYERLCDDEKNQS